MSSFPSRPVAFETCHKDLNVQEVLKTKITYSSTISALGKGYQWALGLQLLAEMQGAVWAEDDLIARFGR